MHSRLSGGSSQGSPPPASASQQSQQHQPMMVRQAAQSYMHADGKQYTEEEVQQIRRMQARRHDELMKRLQTQMAPEHYDYVLRLRQKTLEAIRDGRLPVTTRAEFHIIALQLGCLTEEKLRYAAQGLEIQVPTYNHSMAPFEGHPPVQMHFSRPNGALGGVQDSLLHTASRFQGADAYQLSTNMPPMAYASPIQSHSQQSYASANPPFASQSLLSGQDPRHATLASTRGASRPYSHIVSSFGSPIISQRPPTPAASSPPTFMSPQSIRTRRPSLSAQIAHIELSGPKRAWFPTAPPSRPSSAQSVKMQGQVVNTGDRMSNEAKLCDVHKLDMSKQNLNMAKRIGKLQDLSLVPASPSASSQDMVNIGMRTTTNGKKKGLEDTLQRKHANGAKVPTGAPVRPASTLGQVKTLEIIDLTGSDERKRKAKSPCIESIPKRRKVAITAPSSSRSIPSAKDIFYRANMCGVNMAQLEYNSTESLKKSWQIHQQDIHATRSKLCHSAAQTNPAHSEIFSSDPFPNTIPTEHAKALGLPTPFDFKKTRCKIQSPTYDYSYSGNNSGELPPACPLATELCTRDPDGSLSAPEELGVSEEMAKLQWELLQVNDSTDMEQSRCNSDAFGQATWR